MTRQEVLDYIASQYGVEPDFPWEDDTVSAVFRHVGNKKWFGLAMRVPRSRLHLAGDGEIDILNVKSSPALNGSLRQQPGFLPAYHMNKEQWLSICLDGTAEDETIKACIYMSYQLTGPKPGRKKSHDS